MTAQADPVAHTYDSLFYEYQRRLDALGAPAAKGIETLAVRSVLDVGCGAGAWLVAYRDLGATDLIGVDGDYVDRTLLLIDRGGSIPAT